MSRDGSSVIVKLIVILIRLYQSYISPLTAPSCRFFPSCSQYAVEALQKHGLFRGLWLALWRICRCNPLNRRTGFDPVP